MLLFTVYTFLVLINVFGRRPCACGGVIENLTWGQHLVFNLFFVGVAIAGILLKKREANPSIS
jgi:putative oxidoreductase